MASVPVLYVAVEPVDYAYGCWCRDCLLPSGVEILAMVTIGPSAHLRRFRRCFDCGGDRVDPPDQG